MKLLRFSLFVLASVAVSAQTDPSRDALFAAIRQGSVAETDRLLKAGANPNVVDAGGTPALMVASLFGGADVVKLLVDRRADLLDRVGRDRPAKVDAADADAELRVQLFVS